MMADAALILIYAAAILACPPWRREHATLSAVAFATLAAVASFTVSLSWPWAHFATQCAGGLVWAWIMASRGALVPFFAVGGMVILQLIMLLDSVISPDVATPLYERYEQLAVMLNCAIICAIIWHGRHGDNLRVFGRRSSDRGTGKVNQVGHR